MPRCHWLPFLARRVSGSREPDAFSGGLGASMVVAPATEPPRMAGPAAPGRATTEASIPLATSLSSSRWRKSPNVINLSWWHSHRQDA